MDLKGDVESLRRALGEARNLQTATSEVLRVISSSPTDIQPVFDAIYRRTNKRTKSDEHFTAATLMYRELGMTYWLEKAEAEMRELA